MHDLNCPNLMPIPNRSLEVQQGALEAERHARRAAEVQLSTLKSELETAHVKIQELRAEAARCHPF
jgi:F0F1-type ATP synthase membrane subunit b/b'